MSSDSLQLSNTPIQDNLGYRDYDCGHKERRHDHNDKQDVKIAGYLTHQKPITIEDLINKKMPAESYVEFFSQNNIEPVKAWNIFQLINHHVRHTTFNPHILKNVKDNHDQVEKWTAHNLIRSAHFRLQHCKTSDGISTYQNKNLTWSWTQTPGNIPVKAKWSAASSNICLSKITKQIQEYKEEIKKLGERKENEYLDLEKILEKTGVVSVTWPGSWGDSREIRQDVASLLLKINNNLSATTGLYGPLLGLAGKVCIHLGICSDEYSGLLDTSYFGVAQTNFFNIILTGGFEKTDRILSVFYHEWFHAFDRFLAGECNIGDIQHFSKVTTINNLSIYRELSAALDKMRLLKQRISPKKVINTQYSKIICTELSHYMHEGNYFVKKEDKDKDFIPFLEKNKLEVNNKTFNSTLSTILYLKELENNDGHNDFSTYMYWILVKQWQLAGCLEKRKKPTKHHPVHILMWLSKRQMFSKCINRYKYYDIHEIAARSFEDMSCKNTGINFNFFMLDTPSLPGADYRDAEQHWKSFFSALSPWWDNKKFRTGRLLNDI